MVRIRATLLTLRAADHCPSNTSMLENQRSCFSCSCEAGKPARALQYPRLSPDAVSQRLRASSASVASVIGGCHCTVVMCSQLTKSFAKIDIEGFRVGPQQSRAEREEKISSAPFRGGQKQSIPIDYSDYGPPATITITIMLCLQQSRQ